MKYGQKEAEEVFLQQAEQLLKGVEFFLSNAVDKPQESRSISDNRDPMVSTNESKPSQIGCSGAKQEKEGDLGRYVNATPNQFVDLPDRFKSVVSFPGIYYASILVYPLKY